MRINTCAAKKILVNRVYNKSNLLVSLLSFLVLSGCSFSLDNGLFNCNDKIKNRISSLDQKFKATVFERDCGATTDISTIVILNHESENFDPENNRIFVIEGANLIQLNWLKNDHLNIKYCPGQIFLKVKKLNEVDIQYQLLKNNYENDKFSENKCKIDAISAIPLRITMG